MNNEQGISSSNQWKPTTTLNMKKFYLLIAGVFLIASVNNGNCQVSKIIGIAKTFYSILGALSGTTTVTPAFALGYYDKDFQQIYGQAGFSEGKRVERDPITEEFHYHSYGYNVDDEYWEDYEPFIVPPLERSNFYCDFSSGPNVFVMMDTIDFRVDIWAESIVKTGFLHDDGPYKTVLKSNASSIAQNCDGHQSHNRLVRHTFDIGPTGFTRVAIPFVDYRYEWPMQCWVGEFYDY